MTCTKCKSFVFFTHCRLAMSKTTPSEASLVFLCENPSCGACSLHASELIACAKCCIARYCSPACQTADWSQHSNHCFRMGSRRNPTDGRTHFNRNYMRMTSLRICNTILSYVMKTRGWDQKRGALSLECSTLNAMDDLVDLLHDPEEFMRFPMVFHDIATLTSSCAKTTRKQVACDLRTYDPQKEFFVYFQVPAVEGSKTNFYANFARFCHI